MGSQTLLAMAAIVLFMYNALNVNRTTVNAARQTVNQQLSIQAVNTAQDFSNVIFSQSSNYANVENLYGKYDDITDPAGRMEVETATDDTVYVTFDFSSEQEILHGVDGKIVRVTTYLNIEGEFRQQVQFTVPLTPM